MAKQVSLSSNLSPSVQSLGPWDQRYNPAYELKFYREGNPSRPIGKSEVNLESIVSIETSKNIANISGTWTITLKDANALHAIKEMDVVVIRLKGHRQPLSSVLHGLVDSVTQEGSAEPENAQENTIISGRCMGKYLQVNSLFLPVWEVESLLPTVLTFGLGDSSEKAGNTVNSTVPKEIFGYIYRRYIIGESKRVGISGTPAAAQWLNKDKRFETVSTKGHGVYHVPYIQFDENTCDEVLTQLCITGFTEGWIDEFGYVVYRPPGWDLPVSYILSTEGLVSWNLAASDVGMATYVEVVPSGAVGISTAAQQATAAGRAPVPSNYLTNNKNAQGDEGTAFADPEYVIEANSQGVVTKKGAQNYWYKRQRKFGLRPYQVTSPLLSSQAQAQAQAEGLLKFLGNRLQKTGTITIPGEPNIRLGTTLLLKGSLRGKSVERTYFIEGVQHEYVDGQTYKTTLELTHGRDPWDPEFSRMVLPATPSVLAEIGGVATPGTEPSTELSVIPGHQAKLLSNGHASAPAEAPTGVQEIIAAGNKIVGKPYKYGGGHGEPLSQVQESYDCSSSVSFLLYGAGLVTTTEDSTEFESFGESGAGEWVTIFANPEHVYMYVAGLRWDTVGGIGWHGEATDSGSFVARHPKGL
jgi:hypothetical protein